MFFFYWCETEVSTGGARKAGAESRDVHETELRGIHERLKVKVENSKAP